MQAAISNEGLSMDKIGENSLRIKYLIFGKF